MLNRRDLICRTNNLHARSSIVNKCVKRINGKNGGDSFRRGHILYGQSFAQHRLPRHRVCRKISITHNQVVAMAHGA